MLTSVLVVTSAGTAVAAESIPELQWPAVEAGGLANTLVTGPTGSVTIACHPNQGSGGNNLVTYDAGGQVVRQLDRATSIDGVPNCIASPVVDKNDYLYGIPAGTVNGSYTAGPNLLAYDGNALMWKYPLSCGYNTPSKIAIGADSNVYATVKLADGVHLIGLKPELAPRQTQPTKILDVKIPNDCASRLYAYKNGIALHGQSASAPPRYYSYGGKYLGQATIGYRDTEKVNAEGKLFDPSFVVGSSQAAVVSMYDPLKGRVMWTAPVSTPGAKVYDVRVESLSGGGVAVLTQQQKMIADGIPATPEEVIDILQVLNSNGTVTRSIQLSNIYSKDGITGTFGGTYFTGDADGAIIVLRDLNFNVANGSIPAAIAIGVYRPIDDAWTYQDILQADMDIPGGLRYQNSGWEPAVTNNTVPLLASCYSPCVDNKQKLYAVKVPGLGLDYPRGDVLTANTPAQPAPVPSVALGDSYSSGQGAGSYDVGTVTSTNKCYKSYNAYGRVSNRDPNSALSLSNFTACGGAVTSDITATGTYSGVPPQDTALSSTTTKNVTITIGGNDIGFADVIKDCADPTKDCDGAFSLASSKLGPVLDNELQSTYLDILQKAPLAQVYVLGYPPILASGSSGCMVGNNGSSAPFFSADRIQKGVTLSEDLNTSIRNNVNTIRSLGTDYQRLHFVDAMIPGSPFIGHDVCSSDPYVNGLFLPPGDSSESFHPNVKGQEAYADLFAAAMTP